MIAKSYVSKRKWSIRRLKKNTSKQLRLIVTWQRDAKKRKKIGVWPRSVVKKNARTTSSKETRMLKGSSRKRRQEPERLPIARLR